MTAPPVSAVEEPTDPAPAAGRRGWVGAVVCGVIALALMVPGIGMLLTRNDGVVVEDVTLGTSDRSVPAVAMFPETGAPLSGVVVVAHGFAASGTFMQSFSAALTRAGYATVTVDLSGHGKNPRALPSGAGGDAASADALEQDLAAGVQWAAQDERTRGLPVSLVGHSMGAGAVVRYAVNDAQTGADTVSSTVAVSLPAADDIPSGDPAVPRNLLLLWGGSEPPRFPEAALQGLRAGYPNADAGREYGSMASGTAREALEIAGREHIGVALDPVTFSASADWIARASEAADLATPVKAPGVPTTDRRLLGALLVMVGSAFGFVPLARVAYGGDRRGPSSTAPVVPWGRAVVGALGGVVVAALLSGPLYRAVPAIGDWLPVAVGGWVWLWFAGFGIGGGLLASWWGRAPQVVTAAPATPWRPLIATLAMTSYAVVVLALTARASWAPFAEVGPRAWVVLAFEVAFLAYFWADERLVARPSRALRLVLVVSFRLLTVVVILASVALLGAPGFLTLLVPLMAGLFILLIAYAFVVSGLTPERWAPAVVQAVPLAYLVATSFPLIG